MDFGLRRIASVRSAMALSASLDWIQTPPRVRYPRAFFGSRRIASLQSAKALALSLLRAKSLPRPIWAVTVLGSSLTDSEKLAMVVPYDEISLGPIPGPQRDFVCRLPRRL